MLFDLDILFKLRSEPSSFDLLIANETKNETSNIKITIHECTTEITTYILTESIEMFLRDANRSSIL